MIVVWLLLIASIGIPTALYVARLAQGEPFDPELHDALAQRPAADARPGTVVEVVQPGYRFRDRVLRHAKVIVASAPEPEASGTESAARRSE